MHDENRNRFIGRNQSDTVQKGKYLLPFRFDPPRFVMIHQCRPLSAEKVIVAMKIGIGEQIVCFNI